jgi:tagatose 6-phosphate kinase
VTDVILCLGLNPALDVTYRVSAMVRGEAQRVAEVRTRAGGKATNVASVVTALGGRAHLLVPCGGPTGADVVARLDERGVPFTHVPLSRSTRRTAAVVEDDGSTTVLNEPGAIVSLSEWRAIRDSLAQLLTAGAAGPDGVALPIGALVVSGSVPPGVPADAIGAVVQAGRASGIPVIADVSGQHLDRAIEAGADVVKPNAQELLASTGLSGRAGAQALASRQPGLVVVASAGPDGLLAIGAGVDIAARPAEELLGNPTGAGDAAVAAIAMGLVDGADWASIVRNAVGASAAAVLEPVAGQVNPAEVARLSASAIVTEGEEKRCHSYQPDRSSLRQQEQGSP